jgi:hypothetical protein
MAGAIFPRLPKKKLPKKAISDIIIGWQVQFFHAFLPRAAETKDPVGFLL